MTRDEAIELFGSKEHFGYMSGYDASRWIDAFVALGMLKLEYPMSVIERYQEAFAEWEKYGGMLIDRLDQAGLKVVRKDSK